MIHRRIRALLVACTLAVVMITLLVSCATEDERNLVNQESNEPHIDGENRNVGDALDPANSTDTPGSTEPTDPTGKDGGSPSSDADQQEPPTSIGSPADEQAQEIEAMIERMTLPQKLGQLVMIGVAGEELDDTIQSYIEERYIGGVILYRRNLSSAVQAVRLVNDLKSVNREVNDIPLFFGVDEEGGRVTRLPEVRSTPSSRKLGEADAVDWTYRVGEVIGEKVAAFGLNVNFAPVIDVDSNPANPVIGDRAFGSEANVVSEQGIALMDGMAKQHVLPVVKHFPGHGDTDVDSHLQLPIVHHDAERLHSLELQPFIQAIDAGADAVMVAHLLIPAYDEQYPASMSHAVITKLLREELGYGGLVITDDMTMGAIAEHGDLGAAVVRAVLAGSDQILVGHGYDQAELTIQALEDAVDAGDLTEERIDESLRRILTVKRKYEMSDDVVPPVDVDALNERIEATLSTMP